MRKTLQISAFVIFSITFANFAPAQKNPSPEDILNFYTKEVKLLNLKNGDTLVDIGVLRLKPNDPELNETRAILNDRIGDSVASKKCFQNALNLYNAALDTTPTEMFNYSELLFSKAYCLILMGDEKLGRKILRQLKDSAIDDRLRMSIESIDKQTRKEILVSSFW